MSTSDPQPAIKHLDEQDHIHATGTEKPTCTPFAQHGRQT